MDIDERRSAYDEKVDSPLEVQTTCSVAGSISGAISAIKNAHDESTDAAKSVDASDKIVDQSEATRKETEDLRNKVQPGNTQDLEKLDRLLATRPDLTPTAQQVGMSGLFIPYHVI